MYVLFYILRCGIALFSAISTSSYIWCKMLASAELFGLAGCAAPPVTATYRQRGRRKLLPRGLDMDTFRTQTNDSSKH